MAALSRLEAAQIEIQNEGVNLRIAQLQAGDALKKKFDNSINLDDLMKNFTMAEQYVLNSPPPHYTQAEVEADNVVASFTCPLLMEVPEKNDRIWWHDKVYSKEYLKMFRKTQRTKNKFFNPLDNLPMSVQEFFSGTKQFTAQQHVQIDGLVLAFEQRKDRRDALLYYKKLKTRLNELKSLKENRELMRIDNVAPPTPPEQHVQSLLSSERDRNAIITLASQTRRRITRFQQEVARQANDNEDDDSVSSMDSTARQLENIFNRHNNITFDDSSDDEALLTMPSLSTNNQG
jgi:hypothetical protein